MANWTVVLPAHALLLQKRVKSLGCRKRVEKEALDDWTPNRGSRPLQSERKCGLVLRAGGMERKQPVLYDEPTFCLGVSQDKGAHTRWGIALCNTGSPKALPERKRERNRKVCRAVSLNSFKYSTDVTRWRPCFLVTICLILYNEAKEREGRKGGRDRKGGVGGKEREGRRGVKREYKCEKEDRRKNLSRTSSARSASNLPQGQPMRQEPVAEQKQISSAQTRF